MGVAILFLAETLFCYVINAVTRWVWLIIAFASVYTAVSKVLATANENGSQHQITCYAANGDWLFITYYVLKPIAIDHAISVQHVHGVARTLETAVATDLSFITSYCADQECWSRRVYRIA